MTEPRNITFEFSRTDYVGDISDEVTTSSAPQDARPSETVQLFMATMKLRMTTYHNVIVVHHSLVHLIHVLKVKARALIIYGKLKGDYPASAFEDVVKFIMTARAMGVKTSEIRVVFSKDELSETMKAYSTPDSAAVTLHLGIAPSEMDLMQIIRTPEGWKFLNVEDCSYDDSVVVMGDVILPSHYLKYIADFGLPWWLYVSAYSKDAAMANALLMKWLRTPCDGSLDPLSMDKLNSLATAGLMLLRRSFRMPTPSEAFVFPDYVKRVSGAGNSAEPLVSLFSRDRFCHSVERRLMGGENVGGLSGWAVWAVKLFNEVVKAAKVTVAPHSIHLGEIMTIIYYAIYAGDSQTVWQSVTQLERRKNKLQSNVALKPSKSDYYSGNFIVPGAGGWTAVFNDDIIANVTEVAFLKRKDAALGKVNPPRTKNEGKKSWAEESFDVSEMKKFAGRGGDGRPNQGAKPQRERGGGRGRGDRRRGADRGSARN